MPSMNPKSINRASNKDWNPDDDDTSGKATQRAGAIAKATTGESADPGNFDAREAAKAALTRAL